MVVCRFQPFIFQGVLKICKTPKKHKILEVSLNFETQQVATSMMTLLGFAVAKVCVSLFSVAKQIIYKYYIYSICI